MTYLKITCLLVLISQLAVAQSPVQSDGQRQVADTERAFAKTMADRDHKATHNRSNLVGRSLVAGLYYNPAVFNSYPSHACY